ncbi:MAG TPA: hypothetical protein VF952_13900 [Chloroflexia bacterium]|jgi:hypothetical protein
MAVRELIDALDISALAVSLHRTVNRFQSGLMRDPEETLRTTTNLLEALNSFGIRASRFSPRAKELLNILNLEYLTQPSTWQRLLEYESGDSYSLAVDAYHQLESIRRFLPSFIELLSQGVVEDIKQESNSADGQRPGVEVLTVILIEQGGRFSKPERLIELLESIQGMYQVCSTILFEPSDDLSVIACDSGSDKSFDFLGAARVMDCVKEVLLGIWDNVAFRKERRLTQGIRAIGESLPVFEHIGVLEQEQKLPSEDAERLRHKLLSSIDKFIDVGATTPEINNRAQYDPRLLMSPAPKLLAGPKIISVEVPQIQDPAQANSSALGTVNAEGHLNPQHLSKEEQAQFTALVDKMRNISTEEDQLETTHPVAHDASQDQDVTPDELAV